MGEQAQFDERVAGLEVAQARQQPAHREGAHHPDGQHLAALAGLQAGQRRAHAFEGVAEHGQQGLAFVGERQATRQAAEQPAAQAVLQFAHVLADGGLGEVEFLGRAGEAEVAGRDFEGAQGVERQVHGWRKFFFGLPQLIPI